MSTPINLNRVRKQKAREAKATRADQNATLHGLTKAEKATGKDAVKLAERHFDGHKRDT
jgi:hypothetical protein